MDSKCFYSLDFIRKKSKRFSMSKIRRKNQLESSSFRNRVRGLVFSGFTKTTNSRSDGCSRCGRKYVCTASNGLFTSLTFPYSYTGSFHGFLKKIRMINQCVFEKILTKQTFPQKVHVYFECWVISIFFTILRKDAP